MNKTEKIRYRTMIDTVLFDVFIKQTIGKKVAVYWTYSRDDGRYITVDKKDFIQRLQGMGCTSLQCQVCDDTIYVESINY